ncbi:MAG: sulfite exporter TauE/SafE family protein [Sphingomonadaceae bacterium]|nr:sulfite exporter TauE/SafE family protein [Sphingomonadaceae bacterium]
MPAILFALPAIALATSMLSGIFGMAGGMVLMGALVLLLPVSAAFVTHGIIQVVANGWRAWLNREAIVWRIIGWYALASLVTGIGFFWLLIDRQPDRPLVFIALGLVGLSVWLPAKRFALDAQKSPHAFASGVLVTGTNLIAGVAGPLLDVFFVRTSLTRHEIVATKALTQVFSHLAKVVIYGSALLLTMDGEELPWLAILLAIPFSMLGTRLGKIVLDRMSDAHFLGWTRWIVSAIGLGYLVRGLMLDAG